jgi:protein TonB
MSCKKKPEADVSRCYGLYIEIGLVVAMALLIAAFRVHFNPDTELNVEISGPEVVQMEQIEQTKQIAKPPPPPRPPVPIEVPNDEVLEEDVLEFDAEISFDEPVDLPPPPPPPVEDRAKEVVDEEPEIFIVVEQMPELIGGIAAIQRELHYPEIAQKAGIEGMVVVQFVVDENGNPIDLEVTKGLSGGCNEEALRVIREHARFKPGQQRGKAVRVRFSIPVRFKLN